MKKIYIHIGHHKTGSSSIQLTLIKNLKELEKQNFSYFMEDEKGRKIKSGNPENWITLIKKQTNIIGKIKSPSLLAKKLGEHLDNVILSSEYFYWIFEKNELEIFKKELEKYFDQIKIIVYIRRQDKQIISHHQQGSKSHTTPESFFYGNNPNALPKINNSQEEYLNYYNRLSIWGDVFGDKNLIIRVFEKDNLFMQDVVKDFCKILNLNNLNYFSSNQSHGFEKTKIGHLMNSIKLEKDIRRIVEKNLSNTNKLLPSKNEAKEFYNFFKESNKLLNERFQINTNEFIFDEDFSFYPNNSIDIWEEETANKAILNILNSIQNMTLSQYLKLGLVLLKKRLR